MKNFFFISLFYIAFSHSGYSQLTYTKSFDVSFSGGNNGGFAGNLATDVVCSFNAVDEILDVAVNKVGSPSSVLWWYFPCCWSNRIILDQQNRYMEFRVKCNTPQTTPMYANVWGSCGGGCTEAKTWPGNTFTIPEADAWTVVFLKIPPTTGGSQNIIDTISNAYAWGLENGNYSFDYFKMGLAAVPPMPTIDSVKTKMASANSGVQTVNLSGISIPNRFIDGLTIKAESLSDGIIQDISILDLGGGPFSVDEATNIATAALQFTPVVGMGGLGDSIIITLQDTIRGTTKKTSFYINVLCCGSTSLNDPENNITIYPTPTTGMVTIETDEPITGEITVVDMVGNFVASQKITAATSAKVDLSSAASGMYIVRISDGINIVTKKVVKQ